MASSHSRFHRDGHKLSLLLGPDRVKAEVECPGEGCEGKRDIGDTTDLVCIVEYNAVEMGTADFLEFAQQRVKGDERTEIKPPIEIEWREWSMSPSYFDEGEYEFYWRPVIA